MRYIFLVLFSLLSTITAQEIELMNKFGIYSHTSDTTTIPYRLFTPANNNNAKLPLIIALHGSGERGVDNKKQIEFHKLATAWVDSTNQAEHPCL